LELYQIEPYTSVDQMLGLVARKKGILKPGGIANMEEAARAVLRDFLNGKITYFTAPPASAMLDESDEDMMMM
jgi:ribosome biogenesis GTPase A